MDNRSAGRLSDVEFRHQWISEAAYFLSERRHFLPGRKLDDWLLAEKNFILMQITRYQAIAYEDGGISIQGLRLLAKSVGIEGLETMTLAEEIIQAIQKLLDIDPCFNSLPGNDCNEFESCLWKAECRKIIARWHPLKPW
ncbi:MAG: DUF2934 domain-containing protein [Methylicorpusculum sp.]|uniref:DUF2934 domain-containing protein n=1 Tax=Methylicorpusculum sp. TaxID=2713644 RepID=UPI0027190FEA|nr:DUF2934 domain-containing protein [Methylicorpusculum sp.]MDO8845640.1 DUF2934 domain-containing protein [Methylicorpusculum sp.]MDO8938607.1 DUF2934 domain-containing protein [Methylicorpusculum sp.]MDO9239413.1 DUF2934 domain-containing protein [Methylicorpusculum sp.]MDP2179132.1 DUF2934 domain-containing protein [Methylicorpusculum sp.]MDP2203634.1 DUF2934 domain-containing protein [Methylicorpusculum sp.]